MIKYNLSITVLKHFKDTLNKQYIYIQMRYPRAHNFFSEYLDISSSFFIWKQKNQ